jgi:hypothetical protein
VRLPPLLGEPLGGCAALVDAGGRKASDRASHTEVDPSLALSNVAVGTNQTPVLNHHSKHHPTAEVADLLELEVQFLVGPEPIVQEAADRSSTLEEVGTPVQDRIFGDAAHHPVEITAIQSLNLLAHKLNQVGRGGLLGHLLASIPDARRLSLRLQRALDRPKVEDACECHRRCEDEEDLGAIAVVEQRADQRDQGHRERSAD